MDRECMLAALSIALTTSACSPAKFGTAYDVLIDVHMTPDQHETVYNAVDDWAAQTGAWLGTQITDVSASPRCGRESGILCVMLAATMPDGGNEWGHTVRHNDNDYAVTYLLDTLHGEALRKTAGHEFGHALGLWHDKQGTIMCYSSTCGADHVTPEDVEQYRMWRQ